jgi:hypothetical protein
MTQHEYISIAIAIILGLAITRLLHTATLLIRVRERVVFHWSTALWALSVMIYILQFWWVGWNLRTVEDWVFAHFVVLVLGCTFLYFAAEMALAEPSAETFDMIRHSQQLGRLSALSMMLYFLVGPYVNIVMYDNPVLLSVTVPLLGIVLMLVMIISPARFALWSVLFTAHALMVLLLTV